ncbi:MAG: D-alanyl-D-alanine carboxypeptidase [Deltaproteobacteria bacterium]|nr:D-alanyl-D-alanine carboxypeptidase [Deltaproteobacteria bacterium]
MNHRLLLASALLLFASPALAGVQDTVAKLAGSDGVVLAVDAQGEVLVSHNADTEYTPASTLKVMTTLLAADTLGLDARFETDFWVVDDMLVVRGKGDPFLVSEELDLLVKDLAPKLDGKTLAGVAIDDGWFIEGITIPGVTSTTEPYDALNSATAVNFNTINVVVKDGVVTSAEDQTPLTSLAKEVALREGVRGENRINIGKRPADARRYAAELIALKLRGAGAKIGDAVTDSKAPEGAPLHTHQNSRTLGEVCAAMLYYSNNYIANQVFLAVGAHAKGAPASLDKSVEVANAFIAKHPELTGISMVEGSGISYANKATSGAFAAALALFEPHKKLLRVRHDSSHKTGTLKITKSVVGYATTTSHGDVRYVISLNGGGSQRRWDIVQALQREL